MIGPAEHRLDLNTCVPSSDPLHQPIQIGTRDASYPHARTLSTPGDVCDTCSDPEGDPPRWVPVTQCPEALRNLILSDTYQSANVTADEDLALWRAYTDLDLPTCDCGPAQGRHVKGIRGCVHAVDNPTSDVQHP